MFKKEFKVKYGGRNFNCAYYSYDNMQDLLETTELERHIRINDAAIDERPIWFGVKNSQQVINYMKNGYDNSVDNLKQTVRLAEAKFTEGNIDRRKLKRSVYGSKVNVPNYLIGVPNCMYRNKKEPRPEKIITIYYDIAIGYFGRKEAYEEKSNEIMSYIVALEKKGYRVRLNLFTSHTDKKQSNKIQNFFSLCIKHEDTPINIQKISYPTTSLSFFRYVELQCWYRGFLNNYDENGVNCVDGCGYPLYHYPPDYRNTMLENIARDGETMLYVSHETDLKRMFNDFITKGVVNN